MKYWLQEREDRMAHLTGRTLETIRLTPEELQERTQAGESALFLDVRGTVPWQESAEKIRGAIRVDPYRFQIDPSWQRDQLTVLYCTCPSDETSLRLAMEMQEAGFTEVYALHGGYDAWKANGGEVEAK